MTDWNVATGNEQPINRTGFDNVQESGEVQGLLVGVDNSGTEPALVQADAAADTAIQTVGALLPQEVLPEDLANYVTDHPWADVEEQIYREERTLTGDRATVIRYGIEMVNDDDDTDFTPGEPVYLAPGGGFTQTKPSTAGAIVQCIGVALTPEDEGPAANEAGRPRILLNVDADYETVA